MPYCSQGLRLHCTVSGGKRDPSALHTSTPSHPLLHIPYYAGTREIWLRGKETETEQRKLVDAENKINSIMHELSNRETVIKEQSARIEAQAKMLAEADRKMRAYEGLYAGTYV